MSKNDSLDKYKKFGFIDSEDYDSLRDKAEDLLKNKIKEEEEKSRSLDVARYKVSTKRGLNDNEQRHLGIIGI